jgi:hypothetical protein
MQSITQGEHTDSMNSSHCTVAHVRGRGLQSAIPPVSTALQNDITTFHEHALDGTEVKDQPTVPYTFCMVTKFSPLF